MGHPHRVEDAVLYPDVIPALRRLQESGYVLVVVSNQSGVGRGLFDLEQVKRFNTVLVETLNEAGISITLRHFFCCPHAPTDDCGCRKPKPGLLFAAEQRMNLMLSGSFLVGDKESDVEAGSAAGLTTILLNRHQTATSTRADWVLSDLNQVADRIPSVLTFEI